MKSMMLLICFLVSFASFAKEATFPQRCEGKDLISNQNEVIYQFNYENDCIRALAESKENEGRFCDRWNLFREDGNFVHAFTFRSECTDALNHLKISKKGLFCDQSSMYQVDRGYLTSFRLSPYCFNALGESGQYKGLFCNDGKMFNFKGDVIRSYRLNVDCQEALPFMSGTGSIF